MSSITAPMVLEIMRRIHRRGARFTAHRAKGIIGQVMRHAIAHGRATHNPVPDLAEALPELAAATVNMPALTDPKKVAELLRAMDAFEGTEVVKYALLLAPLVFVAPGRTAAGRVGRHRSGAGRVEVPCHQDQGSLIWCP